MTRAVIARAPTRLDFGGGWTDVPPYPEREGGAVCNIAISRYATASAREQPGGAPRDTNSLISAAIRRSAVANAAVELASDYPIGAGLGGSSAAGVALAGALAAVAGEPLDAHALALRSRDTEVSEMDVPGGYQDHFAAAFGGALLLTFDAAATVKRIAIRADTRAAIARRGILVYTGESRISGDTIVAVRDAYLAGERRVVAALARMKALAVEMAAALERDDIDELAALVGEHWVHQRALHPKISTPLIDEISRIAHAAGCLGLKALGASGGGCVLALARDGEEDRLAAALAPFGQRLSYAIDQGGFEIIASLASARAVHQ